MFYLPADSIRRLDAKTIANGLAGHLLMENAGYTTYKFLLNCVLRPSDRILIVLGKGNNAGDGLVVLRYLLEAGYCPAVLALADPNTLKGDAYLEWQALEDYDFELTFTDQITEVEQFLQKWHGDIIIDGLLGTGIKGQVTGLFAHAIQAINQNKAKVLALDIPSGLDCDSGQSRGEAIQANWTVTYAHAKLAMLSEEGILHCGRVEIADIGIPADFSKEALASLDDASEIVTLSTAEIAKILPNRDLNSYKNKNGHLLIVAGSSGMIGAAILAAKAATASGAGLVSLALPKSLMQSVAPVIPAVMCIGLPDEGKGHFSRDSFKTLDPFLSKFNAVALGPGLAFNSDCIEFVEALIEKIEIPCVIDADGLNCLAAHPKLLELIANKNYILTPHLGEFKRLANTAVSGKIKDRISKALGFAQANQVDIILKGHLSVVATKKGEISLNPTGNPGLAVAGSGDLLTGIIGTLLAQGLKTKEAGQAGAYIHGVASDMALVNLSTSALGVENILLKIGSAVKFIKEI